MSYKQFVTDLNNFYKDASHKGVHYEIAQKVVRDSWIKAGRYDELIDFILENWDSGNCDDFIEPFEKLLIEESHPSRFKRLWSGQIFHRLTKFMNYLNHYLEENKKIDAQEIDKIDVSDFNMFSVESYKNLKRVIAFHRRFLLDGIKKYRTGLTLLKDESENQRLNDLEAAITNLNKTEIRTKNWR